MARDGESARQVGVLQRVVAALALVVALGAGASTFRSFSPLSTVTCGAPLFGSKVTHRAPADTFLYGREGSLCSTDGNSRLTTAIVVAILGLAVGVGGMVLPLGLPWWLTGEDGPFAVRRYSDAGGDPAASRYGSGADEPEYGGDTTTPLVGPLTKVPDASNEPAVGAGPRVGAAPRVGAESGEGAVAGVGAGAALATRSESRTDSGRPSTRRLRPGLVVKAEAPASAPAAERQRRVVDPAGAAEGATGSEITGTETPGAETPASALRPRRAPRTGVQADVAGTAARAKPARRVPKEGRVSKEGRVPEGEGPRRAARPARPAPRGSVTQTGGEAPPSRRNVARSAEGPASTPSERAAARVRRRKETEGDPRPGD